MKPQESMISGVFLYFPLPKTGSPLRKKNRTYPLFTGGTVKKKGINNREFIGSLYRPYRDLIRIKAPKVRFNFQ